MMRRMIVVVVCGAMLGVIAGCAKEQPKPEPTAANGPRLTPPPPGSALAKVHEGMTEKEVADILGPPDDSHVYVTGKAFIPWYFGPDQSRFATYYKGKGRVIFSGGNQWGAGRGKVVRVEYDPTEDGRAATK